MYIKVNIKIVILFLVGGLNVFAQDFELFKIESTYYPMQNIEESDLNREIGFWEWSAKLTIPQLLKNEKSLLLHQLRYTNLRAEMEGNLLSGPTEATKTYHTMSYGLSWIETLNPKWQLVVNVLPTLASDLEGALSGDDFLFLANAIAIRTKNSRFKYGFGLAYTTSFGRQLVIPMGMLKYRTNTTAIDLLLPNKLSVIFHINKPFNYGLQARLDGGLFNNNSTVQIINEEVDATSYSRLNIGPVMTYKLNDFLKIDLEGGMAVGRRLTFIDSNDDTFNRTPENGLFFKVGLSISPKKKNKNAPKD
ncbi:DUF6268 family outer membrane beta-barrel protein [Seonamhaeicola sp.]|uniref:DUF6268 family outer membrane beta-barrel protein n=1 Tax=Seonamhaeicola sp. TaxID=1912245 RepID=UPI00260641C3|nr:DUF6268 family outer membrane beta-barrel protein [Seonamhaeicola sp.]